MGTIAALIMVALFVILLIFVFSTALLTPIIGKKNLLFVVMLGFTVGIVGGAFFIAPILNDLPDMAKSFYQSSSTTETISVNVSTSMNISKFIDDTKKIEGVKSVQSTNMVLKTDQFSGTRGQYLNERIPMVAKEVKSITVVNNNTILLGLDNGADPQEVAKKISEWMMLVGGIETKYSAVTVNVDVEADKADAIAGTISKQEVVVVGINGPVEKQVKALKESLPTSLNAVIICGFIGMLTGLAGVFVDTILGIFKDMRDKIIKSD